MAKKWESRVDKVIKYIIVSGKKALIDAGLTPDGPEIKKIPASRAGILVGTAMGGMKVRSHKETSALFSDH